MTEARPQVKPAGGGFIVECAPGTGDGQARALPADPGHAHLTVLSSRGTFPSQTTVAGDAAGALAAVLLEAYAPGGLDRVRAALQTVATARNTGNGEVSSWAIDELSNAVGSVMPPALPSPAPEERP